MLQPSMRRRSTVLGVGLIFLLAMMHLFGWLRNILLDSIVGIPGILLHHFCYCMMMVLPLLLLLRLTELPAEELLPMGRSRRGVFGIFFFAIGMVLLINVLGSTISASLFGEGAGMSANFLMGETETEQILSLVLTALCPAVLEELLFRGAVLQMLRPAGSRLSIWLSAAVFMLCHSMPGQWIAAFGAGLLFGRLALVTGSLRLGMVIHFANNLLAGLALLYPDNLVISLWAPALLILWGMCIWFFLWMKKTLRLPVLEAVHRRGLITVPLVLAVILLAVNAFASLLS